MATGDPLRAEIVASLARPGSNITGVALYASELSGKRVEVFKEAVPGITRLAILGNAENPVSQYSWEDTQPAARQLAIEPQLFMVRGSDELAGAFAAMQRTGASAVVILPDPIFNTWRRHIIALAAERGLPAMSQAREFVEDGGLISYGPNILDMIRRSAALVDKVLKGAKPANLPIEQPTKFELAINLKTAKALGLTVKRPLRGWRKSARMRCLSFRAHCSTATGLKLLRWRRSTLCPPSIRTAPTRTLGDSWDTARAAATRLAKPASMSVASSKARSRLTCR